MNLVSRSASLALGGMLGGLLCACQPSTDARANEGAAERATTPVDQQLIPVPDWVSWRLGSSEHPIGMLTAFTRCEAAGVFPGSAGEAIYEDALKLTPEGEARTRLEKRFFDSVATGHPFYGMSTDISFGRNVQYPARAFVDELDRLRPDPPPSKGEFETTPEFELRKLQHSVQTAGMTADFHYILAAHVVFSGDMLPTYANERAFEYNADTQVFEFSGTLARMENRAQITWILDKPTVTHEDGFSLQPNVSVDYVALREKFRFAVPRDTARELSPYIVAVVHAKRSYDPLSGDKKIAPVSIEARNVCTGEKLATFSFDAG